MKKIFGWTILSAILLLMFNAISREVGLKGAVIVLFSSTFLAGLITLSLDLIA